MTGNPSYQDSLGRMSQEKLDAEIHDLLAMLRAAIAEQERRRERVSPNGSYGAP